MSEDTISREKTYKVLTEYYHHKTEMQHEALREALDRVPSAESEEFEWCTGCKEYDQEAHCCHRWTKVIRKTVEELKSAEPERKTGKWVKTGQSFIFPDKFKGYSCSCCGLFISRENPLFLFCPSCGAEMKGAEDEAD